MADIAALLVDEALPHAPMQQWVFSVPFHLRFLFASQPKEADGQDEKPPVPRRAALTWAQRLIRVFNVDVQTCHACGGAVNR
jgi:hypothetical protein